MPSLVRVTIGGCGLDIGFINHLQVVTTNNYNTIADFPTLQITTFEIFSIHSLVTASTGGDSSVSHTQVLSSLHRVLYRADLVAPVVFRITPRHRPHRMPHFKQCLYCCTSICCCRNIFTKPLPRNGSGIFAYLSAFA
jgi:hypothetical protein